MEATAEKKNLVAEAAKAADRYTVAVSMNLDPEVVRIRRVDAAIAAARVRQYDIEAAWLR